MSDDSSAVAQDTDVEQHHELDSASAEPAPPHSDTTTQPELAAMSAELTKWQARVPKLAGALKERTTLVAQLEQQIAQLQEAADRQSTVDQSAGVRARDELIAELEEKQRSLNERNRQAETELHSRSLELEEIKQEVGAWRDKWQAMAASLDEQAHETAAMKQQRDASQEENERLLVDLTERKRNLDSKLADNAELHDQLASLESRNANLLETTELANTQIEALGENMVSLKARVSEREHGLQELTRAHEEQVQTSEDRQRQIEALQADLDKALQLTEKLLGDHADQQAASQGEIQVLGDKLTAQATQLESLQQELDRQATATAQVQQARKEDLDRAAAERTSLIAEHDRLVAQSDAEHLQALDQATAAQRAEERAQRTQQATTLVSLEQSYELALHTQSGQHEQDLNALTVEHQQLVSELTEQQQQLEKGLRTEQAATLLSVEQSFEHSSRCQQQLAQEQLQAAAQGSAERLAALEQALAAKSTELDQALTAKPVELEQALSAKSVEYERLLSVQQTQHASELVSVEAGFEQALQTQQQLATSQRAERESTQRELQSQLEDLQQKQDRQCGDISHLEAELQASAESLQAAQSESLLQQEGRVAAETELGQMRVQLEQASADIQALREEAETERQNRAASVVDAQAAIEGVQQELQQSNEQLQAAIDDATEAKDETLMAVAAAETAHAQAEETGAALAQAQQAHVEQHQALETTHQEQLATAEQALQTQQRNNEALEANLQTALRESSESQAHNEQAQVVADERATELNALNQSLRTQLQALEQRYQDQQQALEQRHQEQVSALDERHQEQQQTLQQQQQALNLDYQDKLTNADDALTAAQQEASALQASISALQDKQGEAQSEIDRLSAHVEQLDGTHQSELTAFAEELVTTRRQAEATERASEERLRILELEHADIQNALTQAEGQVTEQTDQRDQVTQRVRELEQQLSYAEQTDAELRTLREQQAYATQELENQQAKLDELDELERALHTSELNQTQLQGQYDDLLEEQTRLREELARQVDVAGQDNQTQLQERITITALEAQVVQLEEVTSERDSYVAAVMNLEDELQVTKRRLQAIEAHQESSSERSAQDPDQSGDVRRLEELVRERTEEANRLRWQLNLKEEAERKEADNVPSSEDESGGDKILLVLNQQLQNAQQENQRLAAEVRRLGAEAVVAAPEVTAASPSTGADDLTRIRGIGEKLVEHLANLGIHSFAQIAELNPDDFEQEEHPLFAHRARIVRDEWSRQAAGLLG